MTTVDGSVCSHRALASLASKQRTETHTHLQALQSDSAVLTLLYDGSNRLIQWCLDSITSGSTGVERPRGDQRWYIQLGGIIIPFLKVGVYLV